MKTFEQLKKELNLMRFLESELGTMYFAPELPEHKKVIVRHLDGTLTNNLLPVYVDLYISIIKTINTNAILSDNIFIPNLVEVGYDYFIRPFYIYFVSTRRYFDEDEPLPAPDEYFVIIDALKKEFAKFDKNNIVYKVLKISLLELTGKTILDNFWNKLIIVEPKISIADLEEWKFVNKL